MERSAERPALCAQSDTGASPGGSTPRTLGMAALVGLAAGLVGSFVMDRVQDALPPPDTGDGDPATVVTATRLYRHVTGAPLPGAWKAQTGALVHYGLGGMLGATYGVVAEYWPSATRGRGVVFGLSAAIILDEMLVPAIGLTKAPWRYGTATHLYSLLSHAIFGASVDAARRSLRQPAAVRAAPPP